MIELSCAGARAVVSAYGASLRRLVVDGEDLVQPTDRAAPDGSERPPGAAGIVLVPWPNRVAGATWTYDGGVQRLEVTEPGLGNALHGLLADSVYDVVARDATSVTLAAEVRDRAGYPFTVSTQVTYEVHTTGVRVTHTLTNAGSAPAPVALGAHPYLRVGAAPVDDLLLTIDASTALLLDDNTHLPIGLAPVEGTLADLRAGRRVADAVRHIGYTGLRPRHDGVLAHHLTRADGARTTLWSDPAFAWTQVWITDSPPAGADLAVAVEPMTAPPDALNSGEGLRWLPSGQRWSPQWGITLDTNRRSAIKHSCRSAAEVQDCAKRSGAGRPLLEVPRVAACRW